MIGFVIDSSSQIPRELVERFDVEVVPITVTIDDEPFREGVDIDADAFYEMISDPLPDIGTSQPSPGEFVEAFEAVTSRGATEILCVTLADKHSGTFNAARIATEMSPSPVRLVNSDSMSFGVTACFWQAAAAIADGIDLETAATAAEALAPDICSVFMLASLDQVAKMGRVDAGELEIEGGAPDDIGVYLTRGPDLDVVGAAGAVDDLVEMMLAQVPSDAPVRTGVCLAAPETAVYADALTTGLDAMDNVVETVRYRVGPSVAAHTGPGTAGLFWWPTGS